MVNRLFDRLLSAAALLPVRRRPSSLPQPSTQVSAHATGHTFLRKPDTAMHFVNRIPPVIRRTATVLLHLGLIVGMNYLAFWLRFDGRIPGPEWEHFSRALPWLVLVRGVLFVPYRLYDGLWRYAGIWDLRNIVAAIGTSTIVFYVLVTFVFRLMAYPRSVFIIDAVLLLVAVGGIRLISRLRRPRTNGKAEKRVLIYGAGDAGEMIVHDMRRYSDYHPIGFVDDDPAKVGQRIHGVLVLGTRKDLPHIMEKEHPQEVLVAVPRADAATMRGVVEALRPFKVKLTTLPNLKELLDGTVQLSQIRNLSIEDLLSRAPIGLNLEPVRDQIAGKRVMVTGAGGSIGSELCRQIAALQPVSLILYERYENGLYAVVNDLDSVATTAVHAVIGDITDERRLNGAFAAYRPQIVFHAAAHKHVPLMELNICEAVKNNVTGTRLLTEAAERYGVERFVLISTDKAVNPSSVMGATKRVAELMVQSMSQRSRARFVAVRFGNVLGSNGSVVPRFLEQIKAGGPVTVTHPEIRRYFMMIPEAVQLVLQAAAHGRGGELFVLDMGEQILLVEFARNLIRLSGFLPEEEIPITYIGLRPGEKLYEELAGLDEKLEPSAVEKIFQVRAGTEVTPAILSFQLSELEQAAIQDDTAAVLQHLQDVVPTFQPLDAPNVAAVRARRETRRPPIVIHRRFSDKTSFEYVQVVADRRDPNRVDRRTVLRGGRRRSDLSPPVVRHIPVAVDTEKTGTAV